MTKILVIEDDEWICENVRDLLALEDFTVLTALDGNLGISTALQERPDLILCDIMMPGCDGYEVLATLRANEITAGTPFIFLTAKVDRSSMREGMDLGADDYITKPFTAHDLLTAVRTRLDRQTQHDKASEQDFDEQRRLIIEILSSELRESLVSWVTMQEMISEQLAQLSSDELQEMLRALRLGSRHIRHMVEQLTFAAQLQMGTLNYRTIRAGSQPTNLAEAVEAATNLARTFANRNSGAFVQRDRLDRAIQISCHRASFGYSLTELIVNSLGVLSDGSALVINLWQADALAWVQIIIQSDPDLVASVDPLLRLLSMSEPDRPLQSLQERGISIAKQILKLHGGSLQFGSLPGHAYQIQIGLPLLQSV